MLPRLEWGSNPGRRTLAVGSIDFLDCGSHWDVLQASLARPKHEFIDRPDELEMSSCLKAIVLGAPARLSRFFGWRRGWPWCMEVLIRNSGGWLM
jgi:hypothetical protein